MGLVMLVKQGWRFSPRKSLHLNPWQFCETPKHCSSDNGVKLPQITGSRNESDGEKNDLVFEDNDEESKEGEDSNLAIYCLKFVIVFFPSSGQSMEEQNSVLLPDELRVRNKEKQMDVHCIHHFAQSLIILSF